MVKRAVFEVEVLPSTDVLLRLNGAIPSGDVDAVIAVLDAVADRVAESGSTPVGTVWSYDLALMFAPEELAFRFSNG